MSAATNHVESPTGDSRVADQAGEIRAKTELPLPDSANVASGVLSEANCIATYDSEYAKSSSWIPPATPREIMEKL